MIGYNWEGCPPNVRRQSDLIRNYLTDYLGEAIVGVYVHGSLALGKFLPARSDLDMLIVVDRPLAPEERFKLMIAFLSLHKQPVPVEASIVTNSDLDAWTHPLPYQFHFSEHWRKRFEAMEAKEDDTFWRFRGQATDPDLACHVRLTKLKGISLHGPAASELLPDVPEEHFWDAIRCEADDHLRASGDLEFGGVLSLLRIWSYREEGVIYSKSDAGRWAAERLSEPHRSIVLGAVAEYESNESPLGLNQEEMTRFKTFLKERIYANGGATVAREA